MAKRQCSSPPPDPKRPCSNQDDDVSLLNEKQRKVYDAVSNNKGTLRLIVQGVAGTGKSFLIKCIHSLLGDKVVLTAPTGVAAFNIEGTTLHSLFMLPINSPYKPLPKEELKILIAVMRKVEYIIIDEISMIGLRLLDKVAGRLNEIEKDNVSILLFGDFGQLPPVKDIVLYSSGDTLYDKGKSLYQSFKNSMFLTESMRQAADPEFRSLLNHVRSGHVTHAEWLVLMSRAPNHVNNLNEFDNAIELYTTRRAAEAVNMEKLIKLGEPLRIIIAHHTGDKKAHLASPDLAGGLEAKITLANNSRVMLTTNMDISRGLYNGSLGSVISIAEEEIVIQFDHLSKPTNVTRA